MTGVLTQDFPILALFVFGCAYLVRYFDGPFDILLRFRSWIGIRRVETVVHMDNRITTLCDEKVSDRLLAKLVACCWCLATWISITVSGAYCIVYGYTALEWVIMTFAMLAVAGVLHDIITRE